ncbi:peptidoglycan DD-metalloendopeptidase family protein, partial [Chryseobacterium sp. CCH4-E10]|uniref:peptidoglycan DD-metalloendopeptidase family protein n=1 Tax=Chryseobacterium sp. CCH4-E10 TaxID=1768758 RepID=UPI000B1FEA7A
HHKSNTPIATQKTKVDHNGIAVTEFLLSKALMQKAIQGETDPKQVEFYVTVEYYKNKKHATDNVEVNNPFQQTANSQPKKPSPPSVPKAKGSPAEQKPKSKKEEKGIMESIADQFLELWDWSESKGTIKKEQPPTRQKPEGRSPAVVSEIKQEKKTTEGKCQRCEILTKEEVDKIFTSASEDNKKALLTAFNDGNLKFEINTCLRKAHFFAQVLEEVGTSLKLSEPESFNYSARRLKDGDYVKGTGWVKDLVNGGHYASGTWKSSPFSYFKTHHREADLYGRKDLNKYNDNGIQAANSKEIANLVYADKNRDPKYRLGNTQDGDGWKFMGKGIIQVTGRANYTKVNKRLEKMGYNFDIVNNPDNVLKHKESVFSSMAFWYWKDLQLKSDKGGKEIVDSITKIVNEATSTYSERRENFDKMYSVFQVNKCSPVKKEEEQKLNGRWRMPIDNPMLCLYSQGGGEKPWHGSFGEKIRDGSENHAGVDLLAKPGLPVYACLKGFVERIYISTSRAGRVVVIKVTDKETFKSLKRNYTPLYKNKGEILEKGFNPDGNIYLVFMHLSKFGKFQEGQSVNHDDIIGYTGVSGNNGNNFETKNPHLHFEVNNVGSAAGLNGKCNPLVYFKFKTEPEMSVEDKKLQLEYKNKVWK